MPTWTIEQIDAAVVPVINRVALDGDGLPHVVYTDDYDEVRGFAEGTGVRYAYRDDDGWHLAAIDEGSSATTPSIAAQGDQVHVAWTTATKVMRTQHGLNVWIGVQTTLHHASCTVGGAWSSETVYTFDGPPASGHYDGTAGWMARDTQIAIDSGGNPHIVCSIARNWGADDAEGVSAEAEGELVYFDGSSAWADTPFGYVHRDLGSTSDHPDVEINLWSGGHKLGVDSSDVLHCAWDLAWMDGYAWTRTVRYADSGSWADEEIASLDNDAVFPTPSLAMDSDDLPHVVYHDGPGYDPQVLYHAVLDGTWTITTVDDNTYEWPSIAIGNTTPHVAFADYDTYDVEYATYSGSWSAELTTATGYVVDIAASALEALHIVYYDFTGVAYAFSGAGRKRIWWT